MRSAARPQSNFYPRSPCGERLLNTSQSENAVDISIHALLAESDQYLISQLGYQCPFLSTLSLRRATMPITDRIVAGFISIHALLAESDAGVHVQRLAAHISIHALLAESDLGNHQRFVRTKVFLSTLSLRRATNCIAVCNRHRPISIHALLAESDVAIKSFRFAHARFLSTLSLRRATVCKAGQAGIIQFLATLSLRRATPRSRSGILLHEYFYPRSPCGERQRA